MAEEVVTQSEGEASVEKTTPAEPKLSPSAWKGFIDAAVQAREELLSGWQENVNYRVMKPFGGVPDGSESSQQDRVAVPEDWSRSKQKAAQLSYQLPKIVAIAERPEFVGSQSIVTAAINKVMTKQCRAGYMIDECLSDVINASGVMVSQLGVDVRTEEYEAAVPRPPVGVDPLTMTPIPDPRGPEMQKATRTISKRFYWNRVSPALFLRPAEFTGSDWDQAPWLGIDGYFTLEDARKRFKLDPDFEPTTGAKPKLLSEALNKAATQSASNDKWVRVRQVWYYAALYDQDKTHPECIRTIIFVDGKDEPHYHGDIEEQQWIDAQPAVPPSVDPATGQQTPGKPEVPGHYLGLKKLPVRVGTLVYVSDLAVPPSDTAAGRPQVREMIRSRSQMIRQRDHSIPIRWYDVNRLDQEVVEGMRNGNWQDMIPVNGPGERVIGEVARANYPRENFQFQGVIGGDLDRAWSLSNNQLASTNNTERSATEINQVASANNTRLDYEKARVNKYLTEGAEVLFSLMQRYMTETEYVQIIGPNATKRLEPINQAVLAGDYTFDFKADSSERIDLNTKQANALKLYNLAAQSPSMNRMALEGEVLELHGYDPAVMQSPPVEKGPEPPNISYRFSGEDLLNPMAVAVMLKAGYNLGPNDIAAAASMIKDAVANMIKPAAPPAPPAPGAPPAGDPTQGAEILPPETNAPILKRGESGTRLT